MAYVSQERKAQLSPKIKAICKKYGIKASLSVRNHSTLVLKVTQGPIDFIGTFNRVAGDNYRHRPGGFRDAVGSVDVNTFWYTEQFDGKALAFLSEIIPAMNVGNHDRSDAYTDYFDVGWYVNICIGTWNKPYALEK